MEESSLKHFIFSVYFTVFTQSNVRGQWRVAGKRGRGEKAGICVPKAGKDNKGKQ